MGWNKKNEVVSNVSLTINLCFGLHCFLCIFLRGKDTNPKNIITIKLGDLKQLMKWRQKSFIVFVAKRKKVCIEVCDLTCEFKEQNMGFLTTLMILAYQSCQ
jgi:hypothetical protein